MDLDLLIFSTLIPEVFTVWFMQQSVKFTEGFNLTHPT